MSVTKRIDMLLSEAVAAVKVTPYAKSALRLHPEWTQEELDAAVKAFAKNAGGNKYEVTFAGKKSGSDKALSIYRRGDDVLKRNMSKDDMAAFKKEIEGVIKGSGYKVVGDGKNADWMAVYVAK